MKNELVSIIVPIYNVEEYLDRCIKSIIEQTYKQIEIILINDGSKDKSLDICVKYSKIDKRIIVIDKQNEGVSAARNHGIDIAKGKYITFVDADDYLDKDLIETLVEKDNDYDIIISNAIDFDDNGPRVRHNKINKDYICTRNELLKELLRSKYVYSVCWGKLYKASILKQIKFDTNVSIGEDLKFLMEVIDKSDKFLLTNVYKYHYYVRNSSAMRSCPLEKRYFEINFVKKILEDYKGTEIEKYAIKRYVKTNVIIALQYDLKKDTLKQIRKNIKPYVKRYFSYGSECNFRKYDKIKCFIVCYCYFLKRCHRKK